MIENHFGSVDDPEKTDDGSFCFSSESRHPWAVA